MSASNILSLLKPFQKTDQTWQIDVNSNLCLGPPNHKHMSGGACMATMLAAAEAATGRKLIQASAQFISAPSSGTNCEIEITEEQRGGSISQVSAKLKNIDKLNVSLLATLGERRSSDEDRWEHAPQVKQPGDCTRLPFIREDPGDLHTHLDMRLASTDSHHANGRMMFWVNASQVTTSDFTRFAALIADYLPEAIHFCIGRPAGAVSLDNALRIIQPAHSNWWLCAISLSGIHKGVAHGRMSIFDETGNVLAIAAQSAIVRPISK